jgi:hypothetical protein
MRFDWLVVSEGNFSLLLANVDAVFARKVACPTHAATLPLSREEKRNDVFAVRAVAVDFELGFDVFVGVHESRYAARGHCKAASSDRLDS